MSSYIDKWRRRNLGSSNTILEAERQEVISDFDEYLKEHSLSSYLVRYTHPDEVPNLTRMDREQMAIIDVANNDKTSLDEKYLMCRNTCDIEVGCYVHWNEDYWLVIFEETKPTMTHKKYTMRRCQMSINIKYKNHVYPIPVSILNLTLYSKGLHDYKYITVGDAKRNIFVGASEVTKAMNVGSRLAMSSESVYKITHVNDFEYTRRVNKGVGLLKWLVIETTFLVEDDKENAIAYNPVSLPDTVRGINGETSISAGMKNKYSIEYSGKVTFELDGTSDTSYDYVTFTDNGDNTCTLTQGLNFDTIGDVITILAKDEEGNLLDKIDVLVRGV